MDTARYTSAYGAAEIASDGRFLRFSIKLCPYHERYGYWVFHEQDDLRAYQLGYRSPEEVVLAATSGLRTHDDIRLSWVAGMLNTYAAVWTGTATQHIRAIAEEDRLLGLTASHSNQLPTYHPDPDRRLLGVRSRRSYGHLEQESSGLGHQPRTALLASSSLRPTPSLSYSPVVPSPSVYANDTPHRLIHQDQIEAGLIRRRSAANSTEGTLESGKQTQKRATIPLTYSQALRTSLSPLSPVENPRNGTPHHSASQRPRADEGANNKSNSIHLTPQLRPELRRDGKTTTLSLRQPLQSLAAGWFVQGSTTVTKEGKDAPQLKSFPCIEHPTLSTPNMIKSSAQETVTGAVHAPASATPQERISSFECQNTNFISLQPPMPSPSPRSTEPTPLVVQVVSGSTTLPNGNAIEPSSNVHSSPDQVLASYNQTRQPLTNPTRLARSQDCGIGLLVPVSTLAKEGSPKISNGSLNTKDQPLMPSERSQARLTDTELAKERSTNFQHDEAAQSVKVPEDLSMMQSDVTPIVADCILADMPDIGARYDPKDPFITDVIRLSAEVPCMDCNQTEHHSIDCNINNIKPLRNPNVLQLRNIADQVRRFDPEQWRTHENYVPTPEIKSVKEKIADLVAFVRQEDSFKNDKDLDGLPDDVTLLLWALKTSENVDCQLIYPNGEISDTRFDHLHDEGNAEDDAEVNKETDG